MYFYYVYTTIIHYIKLQKTTENIAFKAIRYNYQNYVILFQWLLDNAFKPFQNIDKWEVYYFLSPVFSIQYFENFV